MNNAITIRLAKVEDVPSLIAMRKKTWLATYPNESEGITKEDIEKFWDRMSYEERSKRTIGHINDPKTHYLVAVKGDIVVGHATFLKHDNDIELNAIYVDPDFQHQGIGMSLWKKGAEWFDESPIVVWVAIYNVQAINFYKKLGFIETDERSFMNEKFKLPSGKYIREMKMEYKK